MNVWQRLRWYISHCWQFITVTGYYAPRSRPRTITETAYLPTTKYKVAYPQKYAFWGLYWPEVVLIGCVLLAASGAFIAQIAPKPVVHHVTHPCALYHWPKVPPSFCKPLAPPGHKSEKVHGR
jgi:hypothetical protein